MTAVATKAYVADMGGSYYSSSQEIVELPNGDLVLGMNAPNNAHIYYFYRSSDGGSTWTRINTNIQPGSNINYSSLLSDGTSNKVYLIAGNGSTVYIAIVDVVSDTLVKGWASIPASGAYATGNPNGFVDSSGNIHVLYLYETANNNTYYVYHSVSTDGGSTWTSTSYSAISSPYSACIGRQLPNGDIIVAMVTSGPNKITLYNITKGTTSSTPSPTYGLNYYMFDMAIGTDGSIHIVDAQSDSSSSFNDCNYFYASAYGQAFVKQKVITATSTFYCVCAAIWVDAQNNPHVATTVQTTSSYTSDQLYVYDGVAGGGTFGSGTMIEQSSDGVQGVQYVQTLKRGNSYQQPSYMAFFYSAENTGSDYPTSVDTISYNNPPNAPTFSSITSNGSTINGFPKLFFNVSDPDSGNTIQNIEIQVANNSSFTSPTWDAQYGNDSGYGQNYGGTDTGTNMGGWTGIPTSTNTSSQITFRVGSAAGWPTLGVGTWYVRARCKDNNGAWSAWSATQSFTVAAAPWIDTPNGYGLKAQWMNDLANVINNARQFRGQSTYTFTDGTIVAGSTDMKAVHVTDRRTALSQELSIVGVTPTWTNPTIDNTHDRSGQDVIDLRQYALQT